MILGLIPSRLNSKRLKEKPLLEIQGIPLIVHTFKRAQLSKGLDKLIVCTDSNKIKSVVEKYNGKSVLTLKKHKNGTERIYEVAKKYNAKLIIDIQGDEPLLDPKHIDKVINFHLKNMQFDIILPTLKFKNPSEQNIVKVVSNKKKEVLYLSRSVIPNNFKESPKYYDKHLSIISFKPAALRKFAMSKVSYLEKMEGVELLRALENNLKIGTFSIKSNTFSVDIKEDYLKAIEVFKTDKIIKKYKFKL